MRVSTCVQQQAIIDGLNYLNKPFYWSCRDSSKTLFLLYSFLLLYYYLLSGRERDDDDDERQTLVFSTCIFVVFWSVSSLGARRLFLDRPWAYLSISKCCLCWCSSRSSLHIQQASQSPRRLSVCVSTCGRVILVWLLALRARQSTLVDSIPVAVSNKMSSFFQRNQLLYMDNTTAVS